MNNSGFSAPPLSGTNIFWAIAYYFGFPALVAIGLGIILWTIVQEIKPRIIEIETIIAQLNSTIFSELKYDNQKIITNEETIRQKEEDILRAVDNHQHGNEQFWSEDREYNHEELRRLDDIFRDCYGQRNNDTAPGKQGTPRYKQWERGSTGP
jgi:hypothetical protein